MSQSFKKGGALSACCNDVHCSVYLVFLHRPIFSSKLVGRLDEVIIVDGSIGNIEYVISFADVHRGLLKLASVEPVEKHLAVACLCNDLHRLASLLLVGGIFRYLQIDTVSIRTKSRSFSRSGLVPDLPLQSTALG